MVTEKAIVAQIKYAGLEFEGLLLPDESYGMSLTQLSAIFLESRKLSVKQLKALTGIDFESHKYPTELNPKKSIIIKLDVVSQLIHSLAIKNNKVALGFAIASIEEKLERIFDQAFDRQVEEEEREERFAKRRKRIEARNKWTIIIKQRQEKAGYYGTHKGNIEFAKLTAKANLHLFGVKNFDCDRDNMSEEQQVTITTFENFLARKADQKPQLNAAELLDHVLNIF